MSMVGIHDIIYSRIFFRNIHYIRPRYNINTIVQLSTQYCNTIQNNITKIFLYWYLIIWLSQKTYRNKEVKVGVQSSCILSVISEQYLEVLEVLFVLRLDIDLWRLEDFLWLSEVFSHTTHFCCSVVCTII